MHMHKRPSSLRPPAGVLYFFAGREGYIPVVQSTLHSEEAGGNASRCRYSVQSTPPQLRIPQTSSPGLHWLSAIMYSALLYIYLLLNKQSVLFL